MHDAADRLRALATRPRIQLVAVGLIAIAVLQLGISFAMSRGGRTPAGSMLGADFAAQYVAGTILNSPTPERLYDAQLQAELYHRTVPGAPQDEALPYPYAPFLALIFRPLAGLPYASAYLIWLAITMAAYLAAFHLAWCGGRGRPPSKIGSGESGRPPSKMGSGESGHSPSKMGSGESGHSPSQAVGSEDYALARLVAVSFMPFLFESWMGGQVSALGALSVAAAVYLQSRSRPLLSGAALACCLYKPTLLIMLLPMLLVTRRFVTLAGFVAGATALLGVSLATGGWEVCRGWAQMLMLYARMRADAAEAIRTWKYVDLNSFVQGIWPLHGAHAQWLFAILLIVMTGLLVLLWWRARRPRDAAAQLAWGSALTWGCLLSPHYAVYDTILLVPSVLLTAAAQRRLRPSTTGRLPPDLGLLAGILYVTALFSQPLAHATGVQLYTLAILALGMHQVRLLRRLGSMDATPAGVMPTHDRSTGGVTDAHHRHVRDARRPAAHPDSVGPG